MGVRSTSVGLLLVILGAGCANDAPDAAQAVGVTEGPAHPVVVDTDVGADDVVALLYLLEHPDVDVRAITVAGDGLTHCEAGVARVTALVALVGDGPVPVACGPEEPLTGINAFPTSWRVGTDAMTGLDLPAGAAGDHRGAVAVLAETLTAADRPVDLVTLGPLTNVALLLRDHPEVEPHLGRVLIMGGAVDVPGNIVKNTVAEWNIWVDPRAANEVFASGLDITLVPLDATNDVPQTVYLFETLAQHRSDGVLGVWHAYLDANPFQVNGSQYLWDEATAVLLVDPTMASYDESPLVVAEDGRDEMGHVRRGGDGPAVRFAVSLERTRVETELLATLADEAIVPVTPHPDVTIVHGADPSVTVTAASTTGRLVIDLTNETLDAAGIAILRLTDGATETDLRALTSAEPPPWVALDLYSLVQPGDATTVVVELGDPGSYWVVAVTAPDLPPMVLGSFELPPA